MNSTEIFDLIERVGATSKKNEKIAILSEAAADAQMKAVLHAALNPSITYGVAKVSVEPNGGEEGFDFGDRTFGLLKGLMNRELTGNAAAEAIELEMALLNPKSAELLKRIILKDLRAGFSDSTTNKVFPRLIPVFPYQRCSLPKHVALEAWPWSAGVLSQEKADGMFANVDRLNDGEVLVTSRQGSVFPLEALGDLVAEVKQVVEPGHRFNGEFVVERDGVPLDREISNGIMNHIQSGGAFGPGEKLRYLVWDLLPLAQVQPKAKIAVAYKQRLVNITRALKLAQVDVIRLISTRIVKSLADAYAHYRELLALGKEGTIVKHPDGIWMDGTSKEQVKLKLEFVVELRVVGFEPGKGKNEATFGSLICETEDGKLRVNVSGFKDDVRAEIWANQGEWLQSIVSTMANDVMEPSASSDLYSLFLPRFAERRFDKTVADTLQQVLDQREAAALGRSIAMEKAA